MPKKFKKIEEKVDKIEEKIEENIHNIPNLLTLIRVIITFVILYLIFADFSFTVIVVLFVIGMITDGLDGYIARKYNQQTEFGRKFDMLADRFLLVGTFIGIIAYNLEAHYFGKYELLLLFLVLTREIISFPFAVTNFVSTRYIHPTNKLGKFTTVTQAFSFPMILLKWKIAVVFVAITAILGAFGGINYMRLILKSEKK